MGSIWVPAPETVKIEEIRVPGFPPFWIEISGELCHKGGWACLHQGVPETSKAILFVYLCSNLSRNLFWRRACRRHHCV
mgnify:CR=1 FL=1